MNNPETSFLRVNVPGVERGEKVFFGGLRGNHECIWVTNTKSPERKAMALPVKTAFEFVNKPNRKFDFSSEDEVPFTPEKKIYPYDSLKTQRAQENANVEMDAREVEDLVKEGKDPLEGVVTYVQMKAVAKENGIKIHGKKKAELKKELIENNLITS